MEQNNTVMICKKMDNIKDPQLILEQNLMPLFVGWFRNHMFILLMWVQSPRPKSEVSKQNLLNFLFDLQHHFMSSRLHGDQSRIFRWFDFFIKHHPDVAPRHRLAAVRMCEAIYSVYGFSFDWNTHVSKKDQFERVDAGGNQRISCEKQTNGEIT